MCCKWKEDFLFLLRAINVQVVEALPGILEKT
jgi:hypothetical protein